MSEQSSGSFKLRLNAIRNDVLECRRGLLVTALATLAAAYISDRYGAPLTLMALLIGLAFNFLSADASLMPGLRFASRTLLRLGITLIGVRVTLGQIVDLGGAAFIAIVFIAATTMTCGALIGRRLGFGAAAGTVAGGAVAICGASAAMAIASVLGERQVNRAQLTLVLIGISAMSCAAMVLYPLLAHTLGFSDLQAGFMIGASVHDVAQTLGAGYSFSSHAGDTAAIVKLTRVALLAPVLAVVARFFPQEDSESRPVATLPWFVIGFFAFAIANSVGLVPAGVVKAATTTTTIFLACAVTATGISSPMHKLLSGSSKPLLVIFICSMVSLGLAALIASTAIA